MAKLQKWEYHVEVTCEGNGGSHTQCEIEHLNEMGALGWELVQCHRLGLEFEHRIYKRPILPND